MVGGVFGQRRTGVARHGDYRVAALLQVGDEAQHLVGLAGVGECEHDVARLYHAEVAVVGFPRMEEERRGTGTGQRGGYLAAYQARLAHAGHYHFAVRGEYRADGFFKIVCKAASERLYRFGLRPEGVQGTLFYRTHRSEVMTFSRSERKSELAASLSASSACGCTSKK